MSVVRKKAPATKKYDLSKPIPILMKSECISNSSIDSIPLALDSPKPSRPNAYPILNELPVEPAQVPTEESAGPILTQTQALKYIRNKLVSLDSDYNKDIDTLTKQLELRTGAKDLNRSFQKFQKGKEEITSSLLDIIKEIKTKKEYFNNLVFEKALDSNLDIDSLSQKLLETQNLVQACKEAISEVPLFHYQENSGKVTQIERSVSMLQSAVLELKGKLEEKDYLPKHAKEYSQYVAKYSSKVKSKTTPRTRGLILTFAYLDKDSLNNCALVSKEFYFASRRNEVWKILYEIDVNSVSGYLTDYRLKYVVGYLNTCPECLVLNDIPETPGKRAICHACKRPAIPAFQPPVSYAPLQNFGQPQLARNLFSDYDTSLVRSHTSYESGRLAYSVQCNATTLKGARCKRRTKDGSGYCWQHG
jgi:hypothetical protein